MKSLEKAHSICHTLFPLPRYLTLHPVAIDISREAVRVIHLSREKGRIVPDLYKEVVLKKRCEVLEDDRDEDACDELRSVLKDLRKEFHLKYILASVPESKTYVFKAELPREALPTIEDSLGFKIEENVPLDPSDVIFDYKVLPFSDAAENVEVVVATVPKKVIDIYTKLFTDAGLVPLSFEPDSHALARSIIPKNDPSPFLILSMKSENISMSIVEHNVVHYTSSFPVKSDEVTKDFNGPSADSMKEQINKLLIYWFTNQNTSDMNEKIQTVVLTGPYAMFPGLSTFLERRLKVNVRVANVWTNCFDLNEYIPMISRKKSLDYGTAIGLSLEDTGHI